MRRKQAGKLLAVKYNDVGIVPLLPSFVPKSGGYFLPCFSSEQKALESVMKSEIEIGL